MRKKHSTERVMLREAARTISDSDTARTPASSQSGDFHDVTGHHRYYGSSACNGGERIGPTPIGAPSFALRACGF
jgi:hypothetical protein